MTHEPLDNIDFDDYSVALTERFSPTSEDSLLGLLVRSPPAATRLSSALFNEKVLLISYATAKSFGGSIRKDDMAALIENVVCLHLRSIITPEVDEDRS